MLLWIYIFKKAKAYCLIRKVISRMGKGGVNGDGGKIENGEIICPSYGARM